MLCLRKVFLYLLFVPFVNTLFAQEDTFVLSRAECEHIFLKNNLVLLLEHLSISKAEAEIIQAKVWPNPTLTIDEVNFWKSKKYFQGQEVIPPLFGNVGRNQQFVVGFEQLIITAGKRKKLTDLKEIELDQHQQYFEEVLRGLKIEFRTLLNQLEYLQTYKSVYEKQLSSISKLTESYKNQVDRGFVGKGEYVRLKATLLTIQSELNQLERDFFEVEHHLKLLMNLSVTDVLVLADDKNVKDFNQISELSIGALIDTARHNRPELIYSKLEEQHSHKMLAIERASRVPDFSLIGNYDRGDGMYPNYLSFGVSLDLPVFNRNKGNIKIENLSIEQAKVNVEFMGKRIEKEVSLAVLQYRKAFRFLEELDEGYENELDQMLDAYALNFEKRNMSLIEYLDFLSAYLENKEIIFQAQSDLKNKAEVVNYVVGKDIIK